MYAPRFDHALTLAGLRHKGQVRKGTGAPYLVHLVHVAAILARAGYDEDTQIAGLLHDILEDTTAGPRDAQALSQSIRRQFGDATANAVETLTEPKRGPDGQRLRWRLRKEQYIRQISNGDMMALRVCAADKLHNLSTLAEELDREGEDVWQRFRTGPEETYWFYRTVLDVLTERLPEPLVGVLRQQMRTMGVTH